MKKQKRGIFDNFTNLYSLSKTLRFELKPTEDTKTMLEKMRVFEKDKIVQQNYEQIKPFFDELHRRFVQDSLKDEYLDGLESYYKEFTKEKSGVKAKDDEEDVKASEQIGGKKKRISPIQKEEERLRKRVIVFFESCGNEWRKKEKYNGIKFKKDDGKKAKALDILFCKGTIEILQKEFPEETYEIAGQEYSTLGKDYDGKSANVFQWFLDEKFTTYFYRLHPSRLNFYSDEDKDTAIANRIVNENLRRFAENIYQYEQNSEEYAKLKPNETERKIFDINFYNSCLLQAGIDAYNEIIGGTEQKDGGRKGFNQKINEYNQTAEKRKRLKQFKKLYKQILSPKEKRVMNDLEEDNQVFPALQKFIALNFAKIAEAEKVLAILFTRAEDEEFLKEVYFKGVAINTLSSKYFLSWEILKSALLVGKGEKKKLPDFIPLADVREALMKNDLKADGLFKKEYESLFTKNHWQTFLAIFKFEFEKTAKEFESAKLITFGTGYKHSDTHNKAVRAVCDSALGAFQMMNYFALEKGRKTVEKERNEEFYEPFENYYGHDRGDFSREIVRMYDDFRNYLTKKPYSEEKWKLNFEKSYGHDWSGIASLFRSGNTYFVAIVKKGSKINLTPSKKEEIFGEMTYKQLKFQTLTGKGYIRDFRGKYSEHKDNIAIENVKTLIKKQYLLKYPLLDQILDHQFESKKDFKKAVDVLLNGSYQVEFIPVSRKKIFEANSDGKLYLFELYNKDFSPKSCGKKNLHTIYFQYLFDQPVCIFKLNSAIEIFFRPKTKNLSIKKDRNGHELTFVNNRKEDSPSENVLENRRYSEDKVLLHLSIVQNFGRGKGYFSQFNARLNTEIAKYKDSFHIIGIDRGEKHLAYFSVIDSDGKIVETGSFNKIKIGDKEVDYHQKLVEMAGKRDEARKDWKRIANIKELKTGYISQVVRKICDLILKYNAVVVLEDLNIGFKRGRSALDFPIYQKLELALAKKLNFLVQKDAKEDEIGHPLKALQLTPPVQNFQDINRQTGVLFYTTAGYTSTTCPRCGWRKNLYLAYENIKKAKNDFTNIKITFEDGKLIFSYTSKTEKLERGGKGKSKKVEEIFERAWKLYSNVARYRGQKNNGVWEVKSYENLTENFKTLFEKAGINLAHPNITKELIERGEELGKDFWLRIIFLWNLLCQIRNSKSDESKDIILCPACHFHSDESCDIAPLFTSDFAGKKEYNGDANGAYNIARKGLMMLEKIAKHGKDDCEFKKYPDLFINQYDWDVYLDSNIKKLTKPHN